MKIESRQYFALYKPDGYLSQFMTNDKHAKRKKFLGDLHDFPEGTMAVGRLDEPSEGLLLLTTNGKYSTYINKSGVEKEYFAQVDGIITEEAIQALENGVEITVKDQPYITKKSVVKKIEIPLLPARNKKIRDERHGPTSWISITVTEGKFRQIRKMTSAVGFPTLRLVRYRIGDFTIDGMDKGDVRDIFIKW